MSWYGHTFLPALDEVLNRDEALWPATPLELVLALEVAGYHDIVSRLQVVPVDLGATLGYIRKMRSGQP